MYKAASAELLGHSNATQDISLESSYCNLQDEWHVKKIRETLDAP